MKCPVKNLKSDVVGEVTLPGELFGLPSRPDILARVVHWQLAKRRAGTHQTKGISAISGTTKKPHRQKGTGRARQGSLRSAQMRGGAVIFGPISRDHGYSLPKKVRSLGLRTALSQKLASGDLIVLDAFKSETHKTQELQAHLDKLGITNALFIDGGEIDTNFLRALGNIINVDILPQEGANVYSILKRKTLVLSKDALHHLEARLK